MFNWLWGERTPRELPESWRPILTSNATFRERLSPALQQEFDQRLIEFVEAKYWEGCGGLVLTDEHKVTIGAHAIRLVLGFERETLRDVKTVLVYPTPYEAKSQEVLGGNIVVEGVSQRAGESWYHGPVILAWSDIQECLEEEDYWKRRHPHNVIVHEFAHQLDYRNGRSADGIPPIESHEQAEEWVKVTDAAYQRLSRACERNQYTLIDCYGATNRAEFFAVTTEVFFEAPQEMAEQWPELYRVMQRYYRQDFLGQ